MVDLAEVCLVDRLLPQLWMCHQERGIDLADDVAVKRSRPREGHCDGGGQGDVGG